MEGSKNRRKLTQNCRAVSELIGQVLMIAIVVLAFSSIALSVFSDEGAMNPPHTPRTDLQESIDTETDTVHIIHSGGEAIDLEDTKIILNINGQQTEFDASDVSDVSSDPGVSSDSTNGVLMLGDYIAIDTNLSKGIDLKSTDTVDLYFVHTGSDQVIQRVELLSGGEEIEIQTGGGTLPDWITPHPKGTAKNEIDVPAETITVSNSSDGLFIEFMPPKGKDVLGTKYEEFTFGIDASELGINENFKSTIKIDYIRHDSSSYTIALDINDGNPDEWKRIKTWDYNGKPGLDTVEVSLDGYVSSTEELENLKVRFIPTTNSGSGNPNKALLIDFIGIHIENL